MHAEVQNLFLRIHMLYFAQQQDLTVRDIQPVLEERGYRVGEREVKQELEHLTQENFLTAHDDQFSITGTGIEELKEIRNVLGLLCSEVVEGAGKPLSGISS
ncbi:hypothetical protein OIN60_02200 [Paenibacillus sp. P96]|uniref:Uncharacterized protein n=1 Tax=Paenibacillus zeirhizosphaerae TaxID=2987519 RepID=A0ABT9FLK2_9BACL|nr:hypothetical protein [Paenibacillus sp. P96]MDP4095603.1 hypothetical protein [Paenibacillus sp. P96]